MTKQLEGLKKLTWKLLVTSAREYASFMNPHQTITIRCDGIELSDGEKVEPSEEFDYRR